MCCSWRTTCVRRPQRSSAGRRTPSQPTPSTLADEEGGQGSACEAGFDAGGTLDVVGEDNRHRRRRRYGSMILWWATTLPFSCDPRRLLNLAATAGKWCMVLLRKSGFSCFWKNKQLSVAGAISADRRFVVVLKTMFQYRQTSAMAYGYQRCRTITNLSAIACRRHAAAPSREAPPRWA